MQYELLRHPPPFVVQVALLLDRDGYGDMRSPLLRLPLEPSDTGAIVAALHSKDVQGALQAHLAMPVQVQHTAFCMGQRLWGVEGMLRDC